MTNFEYIKTMNEEQFTEFMYKTNLERCRCPARDNCYDSDLCSKKFIAWLKSEYIKD